MGTERKITVRAVEGETMTLGDLRAFIGELDEAGAANTTPLEARLSFRGKIKSMTADVIRFGDHLTARS